MWNRMRQMVAFLVTQDAADEIRPELGYCNPYRSKTVSYPGYSRRPGSWSAPDPVVAPMSIMDLLQ